MKTVKNGQENEMSPKEKRVSSLVAAGAEDACARTTKFAQGAAGPPNKNAEDATENDERADSSNSDEGPDACVIALV